MPKDVCADKTYKELFLQHGQALRNFLWYRSGNLQQAEDLSQEAFIRLWKNCAKVLPEKAKSYLYTVANNLLLDQVKHHKVVLKYQQSVPKQQEDVSPEFLYETREFEERLMAAINELPEKSRTVFLMNRIDGLTYQEIAERIGISKKAVEKRMHKALIHLRKVTEKI